MVGPRLKANQLLSSLAIPSIRAHADPDAGHDARWVIELDFEWADSRLVVDGTSSIELDALRAFGARLPASAPTLAQIAPGFIPQWVATWNIGTLRALIAQGDDCLARLCDELESPRCLIVVTPLRGSQLITPETLAKVTATRIVIVTVDLDDVTRDALAEIDGGYAIVEERPVRQYLATALEDVVVDLEPFADAEVSATRFELPTLRAEGEVLVVDAITPSAAPEAAIFRVHLRGRPIDLPVTCGGFLTVRRDRTTAPSPRLVERVRALAKTELPPVETIDGRECDTSIEGDLVLRVPGVTERAMALPRAARIGDVAIVRVIASQVLLEPLAPIRRNGALMERTGVIAANDLVELGDVQLTAVVRRSIAHAPDCVIEGASRRYPRAFVIDGEPIELRIEPDDLWSSAGRVRLCGRVKMRRSQDFSVQTPSGSTSMHFDGNYRLWWLQQIVIGARAPIVGAKNELIQIDQRWRVMEGMFAQDSHIRGTIAFRPIDKRRTELQADIALELDETLFVP